MKPFAALSVSEPHALRYANARPLWGEIDLGAITHNLALLRRRAGRPVKIIAPVKANAYGHGMEAVSLHLQSLGVEALATANCMDAIAARRAGVKIPIVIYGSQLPDGHDVLLDHALTPTVYGRESLAALAALSERGPKPIAVHVKVDSGLGRIGIRLDEAQAFVREVLRHRNLHLEGIYTHIPFSNAAGAEWSKRRLAAFSALVRDIEAEHAIRILYAQGGASSVLANAFSDALNTISPGHLTFGLSPIENVRAETLGFRKALRGLKARLIHIGTRKPGDDLYGSGPQGAPAGATTGVILFGMDNGNRPAAPGQKAYMLCRGRFCPVLAVSAEYSVIDLSDIRDPKLGEIVTVIGEDNGASIAVEDVALSQGAPSAAYWQVALRNVPFTAV